MKFLNIKSDITNQTSFYFNEGKWAASFCCQAAALVPDMFCNFYLGKNHKIAENWTATNAVEKISTDLESLEFYNFLNVCLTNFKNNQILHYKISCRFLVTTKLFSGWKRFIRLSTIFSTQPKLN